MTSNIYIDQNESKNEKDLIFECQFSLSMIKDGYDSLTNETIENIKYVIKYYQYDPRIESIKSEFEKTIKIWGYENDANDIDQEEIIDLYYKIELLKMGNMDNITYIKTLQRALIVKKINKELYKRYGEYTLYINYIIDWIDKLT